jgi:hypothetical protein
MAQQRFQQWHQLPQEQRDAIRERWERFKSLPPDKQDAVRQNYHRFQQMPPEQRRALREQWHNATPEQRQQMLQRSRALKMQRQQHPGGRMPMMRPPPRQPR